MAGNDQNSITVFTTQKSTTQFMGDGSPEKRGPAQVDINVLQTNVNNFLVKIDDIVKSSPDKVGKYIVESIEIHAEVNGEGQVGLLGTGVTVGGTAGITFILTKSKGS